MPPTQRSQTAPIRVATARHPSRTPLYPLLALAFFLLAGQATAQGYGKGGEVRWERKRWAHDEIPATLPAPVRDAVHDWGPWAEEHGYNLLLDETRQVILAVEKRDRTAAKQMRVVDDALEVIEEFALGKEVPFTPKTPRKSMFRATEANSTPQDKAKRWGRAVGFDPDRVPVIALVHDHETLNSVLHHWMALRPELEWKEHARNNLVSFISEEPLFAVIVTRDTSREEWDLEHETAALLARLMLKRAYGPLPLWIEAGLTWQVETRLFKSIWHFFGTGTRFVQTSSHSGWERGLKSSVRRHNKEGTGLFDEAVTFDPKEWSDRDAYLAWGMMGFVTDDPDEPLAKYLEHLSKLRDAGARVEQTDGEGWTYDINFLPSPSEQFSALANLIGDDFEERALKAFKGPLKRSGEAR